jgi:hypothetical protein
MRPVRQLLRKGRCGLFYDGALLLQTRIFLPQAFQFLIQMFVVHLLLLALRAVICANPGVERVFIYAKITGCRGNRLG